MRKFRIEFFDKMIVEFRTIPEAKKWAKEFLQEEIRTLNRQKYFSLKEIKKDCDGMYECSFTMEAERDVLTAIGYASYCIEKNKK
jgi:hypothetical protein